MPFPFSWIKKCFYSNVVLAVTMALITVAPLCYYLATRDDANEKAAAARNLSYLFADELKHEHAKDADSLKQARQQFVEMIQLQQDSLGSSDIFLGRFGIGRIAQLRRELSVASASIQKESMQPEEAGRELVKALNNKLNFSSNQLPVGTAHQITIAKQKVKDFCEITRQFKDEMDAANDDHRKAENAATLACFESRGANVFVLLAGGGATKEDREEILDKFIHCLGECGDLADKLAEKLKSEKQGERAELVGYYAANIKFRLSVAVVLKTGNNVEVIRLLKSRLG